MGEFKIKCYGDPCECGYFRDGWCSMFDRPCEDVHIDAFKEDGEE